MSAAPESMPSDPLPPVRQNLWRQAARDLPDGWEPWRTVSVVIPAYNDEGSLALTLASLAAQDYPEHLVDVVVVDDGSSPPYVLPTLRPANTRVAVPESGWGRANACDVGVLATEGEIILFLDSDMVVAADHVRQQAAWYDRLADVVTKGEILFVEPQDISPDDVHAAVRDGSIGQVLTRDGFTKQWVESKYAATDELNTKKHGVFDVWTGASASVSREMYLRVGGMDVGLKLGEDSELAYRLWNSGGVFVPARDAMSWHLGATNTQVRNDVVQHHDRPYFAQRAPMLHGKRETAGRIWSVPLVTAVVDATGADLTMARAAVDAILASSERDVSVVLVGPWSSMHDGRRRVLDDADSDVYVTHEWFRGDPRVHLTDEAPDSVFPSSYKLDVPVQAAVHPQTLGLMLREMTSRHLGALRVPVGDEGLSVNLWRVAALERAARHRGPDETLQSAVDRVWGVWWAPAAEYPLDDLEAGNVRTVAGGEERAVAGPVAGAEGSVASASPELAELATEVQKLRTALAKSRRSVRDLKVEQKARRGIRGSLRALGADLRELLRSLWRKVRS